MIKEDFHTKKTRSWRHLVENMIDSDYADDQAFWIKQQAAMAFTRAQIRKKFMCFKQEGVISTRSSKPLKLVNQLTYLDSNISSTESVVLIYQVKVWTAIDWFSIIWKFDLSDKVKHDYFKAMAMQIHMYGFPTWTIKMHGVKVRCDLHKNSTVSFE